MTAVPKHTEPQDEKETSTNRASTLVSSAPNYPSSQYFQSDPQQSLSSDMSNYNNNYPHLINFHNPNSYGNAPANYTHPLPSEPYHTYNPNAAATWSDSHLYDNTLGFPGNSGLAAPNMHAQRNYSYPPTTYSPTSSLTPYSSLSNYGVPWTRSPGSLQNALPPSYPPSPSYNSTSYLPADPSYSYPPFNSNTDTYARSSSTPRSVEVMLSPSPYSTASMPLSSPRGTPPTELGFLNSSASGEGESSHRSVNGSPGSQSRSDLNSHREQLQLFRNAHSLPSSPTAGPFIPQPMYKPHTNSDLRRYVEEVDLDEPIYFWMENPSECGISLSDALHSRVRRLLNREQTVFEGRGPSVSIRLEWPGYRQWSRQIPTKDFRTPPGPITRAKLAKNVAKCVQRFITERQNHPLEDESDARWRVGQSGAGDNSIKLEDLILVSMHHVSMGSWQPQLRLARPLRT